MSTIPVAIDRSSPVPLYHQLAQQLTAAIEDGTLQPGDSFENELALADRLDLSRPTVRRAIAELVSRGLLVRRRGVGTTVANRAIHRRSDLTSLFADIARRGLTPSTNVLEYAPGTLDPIAAEALGLAPDTPLLYTARMRMAGDVPAAVLHNWLPPGLADITADELVADSLYSLMRARGVRPAVARQTIGARRPTANERKLLGLATGDPLLTMSRRAYDETGVAVEYGDHCYRFDQYAFDVTVYER